MDNMTCLHISEKDLKFQAYQKVKAFGNIPFFDYWYDTKEIEEEDIPISKIVGTDHYNYGGMPGSNDKWIDVLNNLKHSFSVKKDILIEQVCKAEPYPSVDQFGEEYYIFGGNNRLCKACILELATFYCN